MPVRSFSARELRVTDGAISTVATKAEVVPALTGTGSSDQFFSVLSSPIINAKGHAAFYATLPVSGLSAANNAGIWAETGTGDQAALSQVVRTGDAAPNNSGSAVALTNGTFCALGSPVYNGSDDVAFIGTLKINKALTTSNNQGIWWWTGSAGTLKQLAQTQQPAPGCGSAVFGSFTELVLPDTGGVIVVASLKGTGVITANNEGIWVIGTDGKTSTLIVRKGDALVVDAQNHTKTIGALSIFGATPGAGCQTRSFNKWGAMIYKVTFTGGTQAVYEVPAS